MLVHILLVYTYGSSSFFVGHKAYVGRAKYSVLDSSGYLTKAHYYVNGIASQLSSTVTTVD